MSLKLHGDVIKLTPEQRHEITRHYDGHVIVTYNRNTGYTHVEPQHPLVLKVPLSWRYQFSRVVNLLAGERRAVDFYNRFCDDGAGHVMRWDGRVGLQTLPSPGTTWCYIHEI